MYISFCISNRTQKLKMPITKKNLYLDRALHEEFEQFCESLGQTKMVAAE